MARTRPWDVSARASPSALDASSTVPNASIRGSSLGARPPPRRPVVPSSPVPDSSSILLRRDRVSFDEDLRELVQLLGHAPPLFCHFRERDGPAVALCAGPGYPPLSLPPPPP